MPVLLISYETTERRAAHMDWDKRLDCNNHALISIA
jgi:hypothetical protein